ncbi:carboxylate-amine ligase [Chitinivorax tropicus]|uniref:Putative glutamate--cysteine ligase 2 n=1 Tax=Chitinivorax tropicus TaxID=714531 RepID=A0A840MRI9_9PROT|nr:YbdK family carboxylate-amine ligase [Chitinivorax tropicus]MBB5019717.1 carboxylate-amine ligase [Chitinivorax tropicus]
MLQFTPSEPLTFGVELELQLVNRRDFNLTRGASDLLTLIDRKKHTFDIKPEITESMIEVGSAIHRNHHEMLQELRQIRCLMLNCADKLNLGIAGGGSHPFQHWGDQRIYPKERYRLVSELYGYLAKQFTVYGQHIHIGVPDGDAAVRLTLLLGRYVPHFIALSASSPFHQGVDTSFQSSRLTSVNAFPLSGFMPMLDSWAAFQAYFDKMTSYGIVASMKDFYWDIRPKPEYGTVEIRVCDTPLQLETAVALAAYARTLAAYFLTRPELQPHPDLYLTYAYNRFQACRFGLAGTLSDATTGAQPELRQDLFATFDMLVETAARLGTQDALGYLRVRAMRMKTDADWVRDQYHQHRMLSAVVQQQCQQWREANEDWVL